MKMKKKKTIKTIKKKTKRKVNFIEKDNHGNKRLQHMSLRTGKVHVHKLDEFKIDKEEKSVKKEDRIGTGIAGLDDVTEGGFRRNSINLIGGGAGSGKSIFCMQFLVDGIENNNEHGIYISFEENKDKVLEDFRRFGWDLEKKIADGKLIILTYTPEQVAKVLEQGGGSVVDVSGTVVTGVSPGCTWVGSAVTVIVVVDPPQEVTRAAVTARSSVTDVRRSLIPMILS